MLWMWQKSHNHTDCLFLFLLSSLDSFSPKSIMHKCFHTQELWFCMASRCRVKIIMHSAVGCFVIIPFSRLASSRLKYFQRQEPRSFTMLRLKGRTSIIQVAAACDGSFVLPHHILLPQNIAHQVFTEETSVLYKLSSLHECTYFLPQKPRIVIRVRHSVLMQRLSRGTRHIN